MIVECPACHASYEVEGRPASTPAQCRCGTTVLVPGRKGEAAEAAAPTCPRCGPSRSVALVAQLDAIATVDRCSDCGGNWVDAESLARLVKDREWRAAVLARSERAPAPAAPIDTAKVVYIRCPDCNNLMLRKNFGGRSGVVMDLCQRHGAWFDVGELCRVIEFIATGGLDEARRHELEALKVAITTKR